MFAEYYSPEIMILLRSMYAEEGRDYHGLNHIKYLLSKANEWCNYDVEYKSNLAVLSMVHHAIWWHDAVYSIYDVQGKNEMNSAFLFSELEREKKIDVSYSGLNTNEASDAIFMAINATGSHLIDWPFTGREKYEIVSKVMLDVDLVGFAESFEVVQQNSELIMKEHSRKALSRKELLNNNINFLTKLLQRKRIFYTDYFYNKCEVVARDNIQELIDSNKKELESLQPKPRYVTPPPVTTTPKVEMSDYYGKSFVNHAGLTGRAKQSSEGTWVLSYNDGTTWYVDNVDFLTFVE